MKLSNKIILVLSGISDSEFAKRRTKYLKTGYRTLGIPVSKVRTLTNNCSLQYLIKTSPESFKKEALRLIKHPFFDFKIAGIVLLGIISKKKALKDLRIINEIIYYLKGWALVDTLATDVVAKIIKNYPKNARFLIDWTLSENSDLRRCAIVSLIKSEKYIKNWCRYSFL